MARAKATTTEKPTKAAVKVRKGSKTALSEGNLADLGAERLASILMDLTVDSHVKRVLKLELLAEVGPEGLGLELGKRLAAIGKANSRIHWRKRAAFARDLQLHLSMIHRVAIGDPKKALGLLMDFLNLAEPVLDRIDQTDGAIAEVFVRACQDLGAVAISAEVPSEDLAEFVFQRVVDDISGVFESLIGATAPALEPRGLALLRQKLEAALATRPRAKNPAYDLKAVNLRHAILDLADLTGDVDSYIKAFSPEEKKRSLIGAEIGRRLLAAGRPVEALAALEAAPPLASAKGAPVVYVQVAGEILSINDQWADVYLEALQANGRQDEAQRARWEDFRDTLSSPRLRAFLKGLPDFDDVIAEEDALALALAFPNFHTALDFLVGWPNLAAANRLILQRHGEIKGIDYELLTPAARRMEGSYPLAATLLLRAMLKHTLTYGIASRYKHGAKHLLEMESLAPMIPDFGEFQGHEAFMNDLRAAHGRKHGFRTELEALGGTF